MYVKKTPLIFRGSQNNCPVKMGKLIELSANKTADNHASVISSFSC